MRFERWVGAASAMTLGSLALGVWLTAFTGMPAPPVIGVLAFWLLTLLNVAAAFVLWKIARMAIRKETRPLSKLREDLSVERTLNLAAGFLLAAANITAFGFIKPQLGQLLPFQYDEPLADLDRLIFGTDPWLLLGWFRHDWLPVIYHQIWFAWIFTVLFGVMRRPASSEKDALLIAYFALWSLFGPLVHLAMPAAGPIFFDNLGLGDRFSGIPLAEQTRLAEAYLWQGLANHQFNAAGGISAMPSLHIATMAWSILAVRGRPLLILAALLTGYMWLGSIALGWHYAVDGIVGAAGAVFCFLAVRSFLSPALRLGERAGLRG